MKKLYITGLLMMFLLLTGCNFSISIGGDGNSADQEEELQLVVRPVDEEAGYTLENSPLYQQLNDMIEENADVGVPNDFGVQVVNLATDEQGNTLLTFLAVNRTNVSMKNMTFSFSMGSTDGEMLWENEPIRLDESIDGVLPPYTAIPLMLYVTPDMEEVFSKLNDENVVMNIEDFDYEVAE
ncbi:hypothetical protein SAMN05421736_11550 [Evansella caseinilytica]|uniref:Lipoprotein n=1 Tax=Evansella caseinilytica TaxID=1503961 RepID=A0A1H3TN76_9BACI|nr:hypothetical protein [Evansella caseinilytica]SDZ50799.1 hypothetical protein SAMN05421736_11550 [Evansella caseinilytica]